MGSEGSLWKTVRKNMKGHWQPTRVENPANPGTPDIYFTMKKNSAMGWIELKHVPEWPKRETTTLKIKHFTPQQRVFIKVHGELGANIYVLLQVARDYFLLEWDLALKIGTLTRGDLFREAYWWKNRIDFRDLIFLLSNKK